MLGVISINAPLASGEAFGSQSLGRLWPLCIHILIGRELTVWPLVGKWGKWWMQVIQTSM